MRLAVIPKRRLAILGLLLFSYPNIGQSYSVLTHQALVDALWEEQIKKVLLKRFPNATEEELKVAHGYTYGGCIIQDLGYYPFGSRFFSDLVHYVRSADFLPALLEESQDLNEYAFSLGAVSHYGADVEGHSLGVNRAVPLLYPELRRKFGDEVTYADNPASHLKTEFGFDVLQVARGHYASEAYHNSIGFQVSKELLARAFVRTYGLKLEDVLPHIDVTVASYRYSVRKLIPRTTKAAWAARNKDIMKRQPGTSRKEFLYNISRASYEKEWGSNYERPGPGARFIALLFRLIPRFGPFKAFGFKLPTPQVEHMFEDSFDAAVKRNRSSFEQAKIGVLKLSNRDLDTGRPVSAGEYAFTDRTYDKLITKLADKHFEGVTVEIRANILRFYDTMKSPDPHGIGPQLEALRQYKPVSETSAP